MSARKTTIGDVKAAFPDLVELRIPIRFVGGALDGTEDGMRALVHRTLVALFVHPDVTDVVIDPDWRKWEIFYDGGLKQLMIDAERDAKS